MGVALSVLYLLVTTTAGGCLLTLVPLRFGALERLAYGFFVGLIPSGLLAFGLALVFGFGFLDYWIAVLAVGAIGVLVAWRSGAAMALVADYRAALREPRSWFWPALTVLPWTVYFAVLMSHAFVLEKDGLYAGQLYIWGDWALHLDYASSFAYGHNFPPQFPVLAGEHYEYHFMPDFVAAGFVANGLAVTSALAFGSWAALTALIATFYSAAARLTGRAAAGFIAPTIVLFSGGLGFTYLFSDAQHALTHGASVMDFVTHLPRAYTHMPELNYQWLTPVYAYLVPQRSMDFGLSVILIVTVLLWEGVAAASWRALAFAGVLLGLTPLYHLHATMAMASVAYMIALIRFPWTRRNETLSYVSRWLGFALPLVVLAIPTMLWMFPQHSTGLNIRYQFGWYANQATQDGFIWFWVKNLGLFLPLLLLGHLAQWFFKLERSLGWLVAAFWPLFVIPNLYILQPWDWDNTKWFFVWFTGASLLVAALLVRLATRSRLGLAVTVAAMLILCLSGAADVWKNLDYQQNRILFASTEELQLAGWVRSDTPPRALFLTGEQHNHPVATLAGRPQFTGYPGWLWVFTLPYTQKELEAHAIYAGSPLADGFLRQAGIRYVVIGPVERSPDGMQANESYFDKHYPVVWRSSTYRVYRVG